MSAAGNGPPTRAVYTVLNDTGDSAYCLAIGLSNLPPLDATALACEWALAPAVERRLTLARALAWTFRLLGDRTMIDHLARDHDPQVRAAAAQAARTRGDR